MRQIEALDQRLEFMKLNQSAMKRIRSIEPQIREALPAALGAFYGQLTGNRKTAKFAKSTRITTPRAAKISKALAKKSRRVQRRRGGSSDTAVVDR